MIDLFIQDTRLKDIDLIIFDKDGTLIEFYPYWSVIAKRRAENICRALQSDNNGLVETICLVMGVNNAKRRMNPDSLLGVYPRIDIQNRIYTELRDKGYPIHSSMITEAFKETDDYISRTTLLKQLLIPVKGLTGFLPQVAKGSKCAIYSHDQTKNLENIVRLMKIDTHFSYLLGGDSIKYPKPNPEGALKIMDDLNISPEHTIFIGDSVNDILCGNLAGCRYTITIKSEISDIDRLKPISDFIVNDYTEIKTRGNDK